jgi:hypothetical protein
VAGALAKSEKGRRIETVEIRPLSLKRWRFEQACKAASVRGAVGNDAHGRNHPVPGGADVLSKSGRQRERPARLTDVVAQGGMPCGKSDFDACSRF